MNRLTGSRNRTSVVPDLGTRALCGWGRAQRGGAASEQWAVGSGQWAENQSLAAGLARRADQKVCQKNKLLWVCNAASPQKSSGLGAHFVRPQPPFLQDVGLLNPA